MPGARSRRHDPVELIRTLHDDATGFPSPALFFDRVERAARLARRQGLCMGVALLELELRRPDRERPTAEQRAITAAAAKQFAERLRDTDSVAVLTDTQVAVLLPSVSPSRMDAVIDRALAERPFEVATELGRHRIEATIGIALRPVDCVTADVLMEQAWMALRRQPR